MIEYYIDYLPVGCRWTDVCLLMRGIIAGCGVVVDDDAVRDEMRDQKSLIMRQRAAGRYLAFQAVSLIGQDAVIAALRPILDKEVPELDPHYDANKRLREKEAP